MAIRATILFAFLLTSQAMGHEALPLLFSDDFEQGMVHWETTDPDNSKPFWQLSAVTRKQKPTQVLRVLGKSKYKPPHRSPHSIALLKDVVVGDFDLTADIQNTNVTAGNHRDLCFFWGYQDPAHFYYVHLGAVPDPHSSQIFIVDGAPRTMITSNKSKGIPWSNGWHRVRVERRVEDGAIRVYFDDMEKPVLTAVNKKFLSGRIGLGTFDDHGNFDNIKLYGKAIETADH